MRRNFALGMIALGALLLAGLAVFIKAALDYRQSFSSSDLPIGDMLQALSLLSPLWLAAAALIFFGFRWRKA